MTQRQHRRLRRSQFDRASRDRRERSGEGAARGWVKSVSMAATLLVCLVTGWQVMGAEKSTADQRKQAASMQKKGNFNDAFQIYQKLLADASTANDASGDLVNAVQCLQQLGRVSEADALLESSIDVHKGNWRFLQTAASQYQSLPNFGFIIAGQFERGSRRADDGKAVSSQERDRIRALQLLQQAMPLADADPDKAAAGQFYFNLANTLDSSRFGNGAWRLQYLSDLTKLPDYEEGGRGGIYYRGGFRGGMSRENNRGAPVDEAGKPVFHTLPKSWDKATTDGQRWRWCLMQASELSPPLASVVQLKFAFFLHDQFGVQTMSDAFGPIRNRSTDGEPGPQDAPKTDDTRKDESGPFAVSTLREDETIARLANGIKRFTLAEEFNYIHILQNLAGTQTAEAERALDVLAQIFEDRQQYPRAAEFWKKGIARFGPGRNQYRQKRLDQIEKNWVRFMPTGTAAAGGEPSLGLLTRNGSKVSFTAETLDVEKLLNDVRDYIRSKPKQLDYEKFNIADIGFRIVQKNQRQYVKGESAKWTLDVKPRTAHRDTRSYTKAPLKDAGAYLVSASIEGGNTTRLIVWVADTAIVKKPLENGSYLYVCDAGSGLPIADADVSLFGFNQQWDNGARRQRIEVTESSTKTDADGQSILDGRTMPERHQWLIEVKKDGRHAFLGFENVWYGNQRDAEYNATKAFTVTDRPVYRPEQSVKFKTWIGHAKYDQEGNSAYANKRIQVEIHDPRGEKVLDQAFTTDDFGGLAGEFPLTKNASLGVYNIAIANYPAIQEYGGNTFRVEEYKKPEFEVKVDAPKEPVMLGDKITAEIQANYYFGAPVVNAKVKYKVLRSTHDANWFPAARWDWFYGSGYWWFGHDYLWFPGFSRWGCLAPPPPWWGERNEQPELVAENEVAIGPDGKAKVEIDTAVAKALHGDTDHKYEITAEVTDESRRTITGTGTVNVARQPFRVYAWVDRGYYAEGDVIKADFSAQTLDNKPVAGKGQLKLMKVSYGGDRMPTERAVQSWQLDSNDQGKASLQIKAADPGQYRLSYTVTDGKGRAIEGGYVFVIRGPGFDGKDFRFNDIELTPDRKEYAKGDTVNLMINTDRAGTAVLLFDRASNGVYGKPKVLRLDGKSTVYQTAVSKKDMPNFFMEAVTVHGGKAFSEAKEIVVPPESRVTDVKIETSQSRYRPGEKAKITLTLTDADGKPVQGSAVVAMYDKAVEYISGGSNTPDIRKFFWAWRRTRQPTMTSSLERSSGIVQKNQETVLQPIGRFGNLSADLGDVEVAGAEGGDLAALDDSRVLSAQLNRRAFKGGALFEGAAAPAAAAAPMAKMARGGSGGEPQLRADALMLPTDDLDGRSSGQSGTQQVEPAVRSNFADTALWATAVEANAQGKAFVEVDMPENLTTWKTKAWTLSPGTRVGEGAAEVTTYKDLIVRMQAPRFFVQKDEVVLSANVHNYLKTTKQVTVKLDLPKGMLEAIPTPSAAAPQGLSYPQNLPVQQVVTVAANGEQRVDFRVKVLNPGSAKIRMSALTDEESDATEQSFPVYIHGMLKTDSFSQAIRAGETSKSIAFTIPNERLPEQTLLEVRYSPTLAGAMVDALPYLVDYPYGCTEQTLNRFLPTVITQRILLNLGLDLKDIQAKRTNLNAQEIGDDRKRAEDWKRTNHPNPGADVRNPVFDAAAVQAMTADGISRLASMQNQDGGWGWFSGDQERSYPHTTSVVVHGLQVARDADVKLPEGMLERGVEWLKRYEQSQVDLIKRAPAKIDPWKSHADDLDAYVYMVMGDADAQNQAMRDFLYRDRNFLSVQSKAMFGLALSRQKQQDKLDMILQNISQYLVKDGENQSAYLKLPGETLWWCWYGSDIESNAWYLKLLSRTDPKGETASGLAKYILNNRKHATYWQNTRDTATAIESLADYMKASGEAEPNLTVQVVLDGKPVKDVKIDKSNLFSFDNKFVVGGDALAAGGHTLELKKTGDGPLYFNAYVTNFTLEDRIAKAGLEIKVQRKFYKLNRVDKSVKVSGSRGQALDQKVEAYERQELADLSTVKSGDLVEIELLVESKNDYEYVLLEDMKAAGFEPIEVRSGYNGNDMNAYVEYRDERVAFFVRQLARGTHSVSYRLRAEIPGQFSALPTRASAMYAPELKANSDEFKVKVEDAPPAQTKAPAKDK